MKHFLSSVFVAVATLLAHADSPAQPATAATPPGFSADVHAVFAPGRGKDSKRWSAPQPLFARDLSNADMQPGAWAFNADGVLAPTRAAGAPAKAPAR